MYKIFLGEMKIYKSRGTNESKIKPHLLQPPSEIKDLLDAHRHAVLHRGIILGYDVVVLVIIGSITCLGVRIRLAGEENGAFECKGPLIPMKHFGRSVLLSLPYVNTEPGCLGLIRKT